ncbi:hypothetical protein RJG79_00740 [Mycoplasmatota bacterium WC44]
MKKLSLLISIMFLMLLSACTTTWERFEECTITETIPENRTFILENVEVSYQLEEDGILIIRRFFTNTGEFEEVSYNIDNVICRNKK